VVERGQNKRSSGQSASSVTMKGGKQSAPARGPGPTNSIHIFNRTTERYRCHGAFRRAKQLSNCIAREESKIQCILLIVGYVVDAWRLKAPTIPLIAPNREHRSSRFPIYQHLGESTQ
jgi:hypothetical protein